jgi:hypothetical protein
MNAVKCMETLSSLDKRASFLLSIKNKFLEHGDKLKISGEKLHKKNWQNLLRFQTVLCPHLFLKQANRI